MIHRRFGIPARRVIRLPATIPMTASNSMRGVVVPIDTLSHIILHGEYDSAGNLIQETVWLGISPSRR